MMKVSDVDIGKRVYVVSDNKPCTGFVGQIENIYINDDWQTKVVVGFTYGNVAETHTYNIDDLELIGGDI